MVSKRWLGRIDNGMLAGFVGQKRIAHASLNGARECHKMSVSPKLFIASLIGALVVLSAVGFMGAPSEPNVVIIPEWPMHVFAQNAVEITPAGSIDDDRLHIILDGAQGVAIFESGNSTYAAVAAWEDDGVQILDITDPHDITPAGSITDDDNLMLYGAVGIAIFESGGRTYAAVAAWEDGGVQILDLTDPHDITPAGSITNDPPIYLAGAQEIAIFESGGRTYAAVAAWGADAVQILDLTDPHDITPADEIHDFDLELAGAQEIAIFESGGRTYAAVTAWEEDAVQILDITDPHDITPAGSITDNDNLMLLSAEGIAIFESGGRTYAAVAATDDAGVQILDLTDPHDITPAGSITDDDNLMLYGAVDIAIFESGGNTYAAVTASVDNGVQILDITDPHDITPAGSITDEGNYDLYGADSSSTDDDNLELYGAWGITIFESGGNTYAAVTATYDDGVQILTLANAEGAVVDDPVQKDVIQGATINEPSEPASPAQQESIPAWIKTNAALWADGSIDDGTFVQAIQFLIKEGVIDVPPTESGDGPGSGGIPAWIKTNAALWADGSIDDGTFVQAIQFLIKEGVIVV